MTSDPRGNWMQTATGRKFYPSDPRAEDICIDDIAHALAHVCRFGGHTPAHYSVAQHSVFVSQVVEQLGGSAEEVRYGLLHDASEAYLGDVVWPLKRCPEMAGYRALEKRVEAAIEERFGLPAEMPAIVKHADLVLLATEKRDVMGHDQSSGREAAAARARLGSWHCDVVQPVKWQILPLPAETARRLFLSRWAALEPHGVAQRPLEASHAV